MITWVCLRSLRLHVSKLVLATHLKNHLDDNTSCVFASNFLDELRFSHRIGEPILIANVAPPLQLGYVALGKLEGFSSGPGGGIEVRVANVQTLKTAITTLGSIPERDRISEIEDHQFDLLTGQKSAVGGAQEMQPLAYLPTLEHPFASQLSRIYRNRCSFSDVQTANGAPFIIRPLDQGGRWHINNFLFLDPEPGNLFARFAWTVGPKFQIIIDADAVSPDISDTVTRNGQLSLAEQHTQWPDRDALAWHLDQFMRRLHARK